MIILCTSDLSQLRIYVLASARTLKEKVFEMRFHSWWTIVDHYFSPFSGVRHISNGLHDLIIFVFWFTIAWPFNLSIDIFLISVKQVYTDFWFIFLTRSSSQRLRRQEAHPFGFILQRPNDFLLFWVYTNKSRCFFEWCITLICMTKNGKSILNCSCFYQGKMSAISSAPPCLAVNELLPLAHATWMSTLWNSVLIKNWSIEW